MGFFRFVKITPLARPVAISAIFLTLLGLAPTRAFASEAPAPNVDFASLETANFHLMSSDQCRADYAKTDFQHIQNNSVLRDAVNAFTPGKIGDSGFFSWTPTAAIDTPNLPQCSASRLEQLMLFSGGNTAREGAELSSFFHMCGDHLERNGNSSLIALVKILNVTYPLCENPLIRKMVLQLPDKTILRGFLAVKPGREKRPLVIFRCGIFCSSGDPSDQVMLMHLFDEGPFNVLTVANMTGADFVRDNGYIALSGLDEGRQLIEIGKLIRHSPLNRQMSSMHMIGISLGGQGIFYASQMNDNNPGPDGRPLFASALAISPVVDLHSSVNDLFDDPLKGRFAKRMFFGEIGVVDMSLPLIGRIFANPDISANQIPSKVAQLAFDHYALLSPSWLMKPFEGTHFYNVDDFWSVNDFVKYNTTPLKTPLLAIAADDDIIVNTKHNTERLVAAINAKAPSSLAAITIPHGNHGAFDMVYGWDIAGTIIRTHVLVHSPEFSRGRSNGYSVFSPQVWGALEHPNQEYETHLQQTYRFQANRPSVEVVLTIFTRSDEDTNCSEQSPYDADPQCYRRAYKKIPFSALAGSTPWAHTPRNSTEAQAMTRWANRNLTMRDASGEPITGKATDGSALTWISYNEEL